MLVLCFETSSIKYEEKNKGTTEYDKSIDTCDINTTLYETGTIKCEEKKNEPQNVTKV